MKTRAILLVATIFGCLQSPGSALAQKAPNERLEEEIKTLKAENKKLQSEIARLKAELRQAMLMTRDAIDRANRMHQLFQAFMAQRKGNSAEKLPPKKVPLKTIQAKITAVDAKDKTLVQLNMGADNGIKLGQVFDVMRLQPNAIYLGQIRIVHVAPRQAVGRQVMLPGRRIRPLEVGDQITNEMRSKK